jgi:hypothetical protein
MHRDHINASIGSVKQGDRAESDFGFPGDIIGINCEMKCNITSESSLQS